MGFGSIFRGSISPLYKHPEVMLKLGHPLSPYLNIGWGSGQGCPLLPFLFVLMMEPLEIAVWSSNEVRALEVGGIRECLALYAVDLVHFLKDPGPSLQVVFWMLNEYTRYSGLGVNWSKYIILPPDSGTKAVADSNFLICWVSQLTYLGVQTIVNVTDYMNIVPLITFLKCKLEAWQNVALLLLGKDNLIKTQVLHF